MTTPSHASVHLLEALTHLETAHKAEFDSLITRHKRQLETLLQRQRADRARLCASFAPRDVPLPQPSAPVEPSAIGHNSVLLLVGSPVSL